MELAAVNILKRAVELDEKRRYTEAKLCYEEGIQLLIYVIKNLSDKERRQHYGNKIESYMNRAETIKKVIEDEKKRGVYHEEIKIEADSTRHSYQSIMGRFLDLEVKWVLVEDPYIRSIHQCHNMLKFCELVVKRCHNLKTIRLVTVEDNGKDQQNQWRLMQELKSDLSSRHSIDFKVEFSATLHDRQIKLSNGWIIKIGRGLDYFKKPVTNFSLGFHDLDLRPCHETTVNIYHENTIRK